MKTVGIITEYNPFHAGHQYQVEYARETLGADYVIAVMSGDYVQRGVPALLPKHVRAKMALLGGADLILELPVEYATASAEAFARGGISILNNLGVVDELCFGSECGTLSPLMDIAEILAEEPVSFQTELQNNLRMGLPFPKARSLALLTELCPGGSTPYTETLLSSPNNILGIEYCKALLRSGSSIKPVTLKRAGSPYHQDILQENLLPSASAIRQGIAQKNPGLFHFLPDSPCSTLLQEQLVQGAYIQNEDFNGLYHYRLMLETLSSLEQYLDISPELARRILRCRNDFDNFDDFCKALNTKEITQTRVQRGLLHMLLNLTDMPEQLPYARILGFRKHSAFLLREIKEKGRIPLVTKPADTKKLLHDFYGADENCAAIHQGMLLLEHSISASNIYEGVLCRKTSRPFLHDLQKKVVIV